MSKTKHKAFKYLTTGSVAFIVEVSLFFVLVRLGMSIWMAHALSFLAALMISFSLNRNWSFAARHGFERTGMSQLGMYALLAGFNLVVSSVVVVGLHALGVLPIVAKLAAISLIAVYNFYLFRKKIFVPKTAQAVTQPSQI